MELSSWRMSLFLQKRDEEGVCCFESNVGNIVIRKFGREGEREANGISSVALHVSFFSEAIFSQ